MSDVRSYVDYNATAPMRSEAREAMAAAMAVVGNPSSVHAEGRRARAVVGRARAQVASLFGCKASQIVFTSGATEANNWVIRAPWQRVIVSAVEHPSVLEPCDACLSKGFDVVDVDRSGIVELDALERMLDLYAATDRAGKVLVSIQAANGETGVIQPIAKIFEIVTARDALLHVDAAQHKGDQHILFGGCQPHFVSISAHKLGGPTGAGALVFGEREELGPFIFGGGQEVRRRAGTENVIGIAGFGAAAEAALREARGESIRVGGMRDRFEAQLLANVPEAVILGQDSNRMVNTCLFVIKGIKAETLVMALDLKGIAVSAGSACSSGKVVESHVVKAMTGEDELARSSVRVSFGWASVETDVDRLLRALEETTMRLLKRIEPKKSNRVTRNLITAVDQTSTE